MKIHNSGNDIVDAVGHIRFVGNIIPKAWYQTICHANGKPNTNAILVLSDIVYWYRPVEKRDETTGDVYFQKKFADDKYLQRSYRQLSTQLHLSKRQVHDAVVFLEKEIGVLRRHFRTIITNGNQKLANVMYLELIPKRLEEITFPDDSSPGLDHPTENGGTCHENTGDMSRCIVECATNNRETNTEITTEMNDRDYDHLSISNGASPPQYRDGLMDRNREEITNELKKITGYDAIVFDRPYQQNVLDAMIDYMVDIIALNQTVTIGKLSYTPEHLKMRFYDLDLFSTEYVLDCFDEASQKMQIKNPRNYLIQLIVTAKSDMNMAIQSSVNYNMTHTKKEEKKNV